MRMGPFTLLDFVGLDTTYYITQVMFDEFKDHRFASPALLKRMVMTQVTIRVRDNGPLLVEGPIQLVDAEGKPLPLDPTKTSFAFCRCGQSNNKPF